MSEQEWNPLEGWTKEQIRSTLKAHSKTDLLKIAMQWRIIAERLQQVTNNDEDTKPIEKIFVSGAIRDVYPFFFY